MNRIDRLLLFRLAGRIGITVLVFFGLIALVESLDAWRFSHLMEAGGLPLAKRHPARQRYRLVELQRWRDKRGLKFHLQPANWPFNARLADGVVIAALEGGHDPDRYLRRAFAAIWEDQLNLADPATIEKLADESGLPGKQLVARSGAEEISATYEQNRQEALASDVFGSPVYVLEGEVFWGQDRLELLEDALKSGRAPYSSKV